MKSLIYVEADFRDMDFNPRARATPESLIDHPFRILVHDEECHLMIVGTAAIGPPIDIDRYSLALISSALGWANAIILNRVDLTIHRVVARPIGR